MTYLVVSWAVYLLSWPAVALIIGWIPLLFPTGSLPGPRWRAPAAVVLVMLGVGLIGIGVPSRGDRRGLWLREPVRRRLVARRSSSRSSMRSRSPCWRASSWGSRP